MLMFTYVKKLLRQLPVIAALLPSLVLNDIATVQALDRRVGGVFFLDVNYGSTKGAITSGDTMMSSKLGHNRTKSGRRYAMALVEGEEIASFSDHDVTGTLAFANYTGFDPSTVVFYDEHGVVVATVSIAGVLVAGSGSITATGTVSTAGVYTVDIIGMDTASAVTATYAYKYDMPVDANNNYKGVPEANVAMTQSTITAIDFPIRMKYSVGASIDLKKAHGIDLENEMIKYLGNEVKFTIDQYGIDLMDAASLGAGAATAVGNWNAGIRSGQEWVWKKQELLDVVYQGSNAIYNKTLRGVANFMVCGNNVARVIRQLPDSMFKSVSKGKSAIPTGPMVIGTLDDSITVVQNPFMSDAKISGTTYSGQDRFFLGWKGDQFLTSSFIYAPYVPLFTTPTLLTSDLMAQKGFLSAAGFKVINDGLFCNGTISNIRTATAEA